MIKSLIASALLLSNIGLDWLTSNFNTYDKIQKQIHEYAEPGYMEYKSSDLLIKHLEENGFEVVGAEFTYIPNDMKQVTPEERESIDKMVEKLEDFDDVQTVYTNMKPE